MHLPLQRAVGGLRALVRLLTARRRPPSRITARRRIAPGRSRSLLPMLAAGLCLAVLACPVEAAAQPTPAGGAPIPSSQPQGGDGDPAEVGGAPATAESIVGTQGSEEAADPDVAAPRPPEDAGWQIFQQAFAALADGDVATARQLLQHLADEFPDHPAVAAATAIAERLEVAASIPEPPAAYGGAAARSPMEVDGERPGGGAPARDPFAERPTGLARAELVSFQTVNGIALGAEACAAFECESVQSLVLLTMAGGGAGLGLSLALSGDGVLPGQTLAYNTGTAWGLWNAVALMGATSAFDADIKPTMLGLAAGQLLGLGTGALAYDLFHPTAGTVAAASSGGIWASMLYLFVLGMTELDLQPEDTFGMLLATSNLGFIGGALLASEVPMTRGRTLILDAGGLLGMLTGMGVDLLIEGDNITEAPFFGLAALGMLTGLGLAYSLTDEWDLPNADASLSLVPIPGGALAALSIGADPL